MTLVECRFLSLSLRFVSSLAPIFDLVLIHHFYSSLNFEESQLVESLAKCEIDDEWRWFSSESTTSIRFEQNSVFINPHTWNGENCVVLIFICMYSWVPRKRAYESFRVYEAFFISHCCCRAVVVDSCRTAFRVCAHFQSYNFFFYFVFFFFYSLKYLLVRLFVRSFICPLSISFGCSRYCVRVAMNVAQGACLQSS